MSWFVCKLSGYRKCHGEQIMCRWVYFCENDGWSNWMAHL